MNRRKSIKALAISAVTPGLLLDKSQIRLAGQPAAESAKNGIPETNPSFSSSWHEWPDMDWAGPDYWGNRLQDWQIRDGKAACVVKGNNRALHCLTTQVSARLEAFETGVSVTLPKHTPEAANDYYAGFRLGAKAPERNADYRCAAVFGTGMDVGITGAGTLFIAHTKSTKRVAIAGEIHLVLQATPAGNNYQLQLTVFNAARTEALDELTVREVAASTLTGNIALVVHYAREEQKSMVGFTADGTALDPGAVADSGNTPDAAVSFADWKIAGAKADQHPLQTFGPICFAQYTLHNNVLKLTAQLAPIERIADHKVALQIQQSGQWKTVGESPVDNLGRTAHFRMENWNATTASPYRIKTSLPLRNGLQDFFYEGTLAAEPLTAATLKVAVFSCNADHGFPDTEVAPHVAVNKPDMAVFLGDQFYESSGGFQIQTFPLQKACLDYLRKWYMFGWSYREVFRHIPGAFLPDDHDVYHGNVWGEGGRHAPSDQGWTYVAQDQGGYKMPPEWVNMVQRTQTGHLPDPFDPTPVKQGIGVYYTHWRYGGVSFAILEDRKFKSAPKNVLPAEATVQNGFIQNPNFDIKQYRNLEADLLGERQLRFLKQWATDWQNGTQMKAVFSQTNFCTVATLPEGSIIDAIVPRLPIPQLGAYVSGDAPTSDMDSNGWPQRGRDEALKEIRKCFAFHIAGDQHLASLVQYGVDTFGDAGYAFAGPALNNLFPRRWWPDIPGHQPLPGKPRYTGNFLDGFGNRMTVHAVANPYQTGLQPALIYDRATGYGIVTFNKVNRTIRTECWPRFVDPQKHPDGQYQDWPVTVEQQENYGRRAEAWLPEIKVNGVQNPVIEITDERSGELVYCLRIKGNQFKPKVFALGRYTIRVSDPDAAKVQEWKHVQAQKKTNKTLVFNV